MSRAEPHAARRRSRDGGRARAGGASRSADVPACVVSMCGHKVGRTAASNLTHVRHSRACALRRRRTPHLTPRHDTGIIYQKSHTTQPTSCSLSRSRPRGFAYKRDKPDMRHCRLSSLAIMRMATANTKRVRTRPPPPRLSMRAHVKQTHDTLHKGPDHPSMEDGA